MKNHHYQIIIIIKICDVEKCGEKFVMWRNFSTWEMWRQIWFVTIHAVLSQNLFCCHLRCFVSESIWSWFTRFCVEKNWTKNSVCGEKGQTWGIGQNRFCAPFPICILHCVPKKRTPFFGHFSDPTQKAKLSKIVQNGKIDTNPTGSTGTSSHGEQLELMLMSQPLWTKCGKSSTYIKVLRSWHYCICSKR